MIVLVATRSAHKLTEIRRLLADVPGLELVGLETAGVPQTPDEDEVESHATFEANALAKARFFAGRAHLPALADDSGICVDALGGAPGVRSKRFSGRPGLRGAALDEANNRHLLEALAGTPPERRSARFVCALALVVPDGPEHVFHGSVEGFVLDDPRGSGGFGYDPLFYLPSERATFGELPPDRKNELSHRSRAVRAAAPILARLAAGVT